MGRLAALAATLLLVTACGGADEPEEAAAPATTAAPAPTATTAPPAAPAPPATSGLAQEISGESLEGGQLSLADFRGKRVLVNVWSSW